MNEPYKNSKQQIYLPTVLAMGVSVGIIIGIFISRYNSPVKEIERASKKYGRILNIIEENYVDSVNTNALVETSIKKMLEELDPHTAYIPPRDRKFTQSQLEGAFEGIGIEYNIIKDTLYVITPVSGGPSEKSGIVSGDKIIRVDGKNIAGVGLEKEAVYDLLRGKKGTKVIVQIKRQRIKELIEFEITRDKIPSHSVDASYMIDKITGYIKVNRFAANTYEEFHDGLQSLLGKGMEQLIIDLRDNSGGYMQTAIDMVDELVPQGNLIVYTDGKESKYKVTHKAENDGLFENGNLIVLINENSASASEIVSGALQDNDRALIVGRRSFGKGLVQAPISLDDGSELRLTISRYYTPSGRCIQKSYNGDINYKDEYLNRYKNGELFYADSIKVIDSLKYKTENGRTVYGGGGIIPDDFIAKDTTGYTSYLGKLYGASIIREYVLNYVSAHKEEIETMGFDKFKTNFKVSESMINEIVSLAELSDIKTNRADLLLSKEKLKSNIHSLIVRSIWGNEAFYEVINENDPFITKSMSLFGKAEKIRKGTL